MHKGGRTDRQFLKKVKTRNLKEEQILLLVYSDVLKLYDSCFKISTLLYLEIIQKYFGMKLDSSLIENNLI